MPGTRGLLSFVCTGSPDRAKKLIERAVTASILTPDGGDGNSYPHEIP